MTIVDQYGEYLVVLDNDGYRLMTEDGDPVEYEVAPRKARFLLDMKESERQGQLKLPL
jgi:hypothetical protein